MHFWKQETPLSKIDPYGNYAKIASKLRDVAGDIIAGIPPELKDMFTQPGWMRWTTNILNLFLFGPQMKKLHGDPRSEDEICEETVTHLNQELNASFQKLLPEYLQGKVKVEYGHQIVFCSVDDKKDAATSIPVMDCMTFSITDEYGTQIHKGCGVNFSTFFRSMWDYIRVEKERNPEANLDKRALEDKGALDKKVLKAVLTSGLLPGPLISVIASSEQQKLRVVPGAVDPVLGQQLESIEGESHTQKYIRDLGMKAVPYLPTGQSVPILVLVPENIEINKLDSCDKAAALAAGLFFQKLIWPRTRVENPEVLKSGVYDPKQFKFQQAVNAIQKIAKEFPFLRMGEHLYPLYNLEVRPDVTHYQGEIAYKVFCRWGESIRALADEIIKRAEACIVQQQNARS
jgi:hypothetical protein